MLFIYFFVRVKTDALIFMELARFWVQHSGFCGKPFEFFKFGGSKIQFVSIWVNV